MSKLTFLSKLRNHKPGSNSKMTDKHAAEYSKTACSGVN